MHHLVVVCGLVHREKKKVCKIPCSQGLWKIITFFVRGNDRTSDIFSVKTGFHRSRMDFFMMSEVTHHGGRVQLRFHSENSSMLTKFPELFPQRQTHAQFVKPRVICSPEYPSALGITTA